MKKKSVLMLMAGAIAIGGAFATSVKIVGQTNGYRSGTDGTCSLSRSIDNLPVGKTCDKNSGTACTILVDGAEQRAFDTPSDCNTGNTAGLLNYH